MFLVAGRPVLGTGGPAVPAPGQTVRRQRGRLALAAGAQLSNGTADARLPVRVEWTQYAPEGYCEQLLSLEDSQGVRDEESRYDGVNGPASWTTTMPAQGSARFGLYKFPCGNHDSVGTCTCLSGGSAVASAEGGVRAHAAFTGRSVAVVASTGPTYGRADVYVDGVFAQTVDARRTEVRRRVVVFQRHWASAGEHRVTVVPRVAQ